MTNTPTITAPSWRQVVVGAPVAPASFLNANTFGHSDTGSYPNHAHEMATNSIFTKSIASTIKGRPTRRGAPPH